MIFNELYEYEFPKVVNLIIKNSGNVEMAQDVFQNAIVILMEKVFGKKLDLTCSIETYLYSICKHLWMDQLRQNKKEKQMIQFYNEEFQPDDISVSFYNTPDIYENVNRAIENLVDPCKQLLDCFYYKNMSWDEIASSLGYANAASARNQKYKCLERIRNTVNVEID
jgi:RNA polymerase sigma factor (sigma-70 family)